MGQISNPSPQFTMPGSQVFAAGAIPVVFTDLDLSPYIGAHKAICFLRVNCTTFAANGDIYFRQNGLAGGGGVYHASYGYFLAVNQQIFVVVETDDAGIVEWTGTGGNQASINLEGCLYG